jgi:hypothetical protein
VIELHPPLRIEVILAALQKLPPISVPPLDTTILETLLACHSKGTSIIKNVFYIAVFTLHCCMRPKRMIYVTTCHFFLPPSKYRESRYNQKEEGIRKLYLNVFTFFFC